VNNQFNNLVQVEGNKHHIHDSSFRRLHILKDSLKDFTPISEKTTPYSTISLPWYHKLYKSPSWCDPNKPKLKCINKPKLKCINKPKPTSRPNSLEAWWERFTWAFHKMIKSIMGFLHYSHGLKKSLKYEIMHEGSSLDLNWAIV